MGVIAKYKFNNTLEANLLPEFNSEFTSDLYTVTDEVNGEVTTRTIESDSLPTLMRFGVSISDTPTDRELCLLEIIELDTTELTSCNRMFISCQNVTSINTEGWTLEKVTDMYTMFYNCLSLTILDVSNFNTSNVTNMESMFFNCNNLTQLDVSNFDTSKVTDMGYMFFNCNNLTQLDVSNFDTSKVTDMGYMFSSCTKLTQLDVSNWDTSNVTAMYVMFSGCSNLTSLDVSNWDTSKVDDMGTMFCYCQSLTSLDVSNWETSNVIYMDSMFSGCSNLTSLDVSNWDTSNVTDMSNMFQECTNLTTLNLSSFDTSNVTNMSVMFYRCNNLTSLDVSSFDTSKVADMGTMFCYCQSLTSLDVSNWDTREVIYMDSMFESCTNLTSLDVSNWDTGNVTNMQSMFANTDNLKYLKCNNITTLNALNTYLPTKSSASQGTIICKSDITNLDTTTLQSKYWNILDEPTLIAKYVFDKSIHNNCIPEFNTEFEGYFIEDEVVEGSNEVIRTIESCGMLPTKIQFGNSDGQKDFNRRMSLLKMLNICNGLTSCNDMFAQCSNLISVCDIDTSNVTSMFAMFFHCTNLTTLDLSSWNINNVIDMRFIFYFCTKLTSLDVSNFNTSNVTDMSNMFYGCTKLTSLDVSNFNTSNVTNMYGMFGRCQLLTSLDVSNFNTSNVTDTTNMFYNTPLLTDIGMLYCNASTIQKIINAMPTDLNKTLWYKNIDIDEITHGNNITLKKYMEENIEIVLNNPLLEGDTIEVVDGKLCHYHKMGMVVLDGSENWDMSNNLDMTYRFVSILPIDSKGTTTVSDYIEGYSVSDNFICDNNTTYNRDEECYQIGNNQIGSIYIRISKSKLSSLDTNGFKKWLQANPTTVVYELVEPYYEDITPLQSSLALRTFEECNIQIITALPIKTKITYRTNITSAIVMEQELDTLDSGVSLSNLIEEEVNE